MSEYSKRSRSSFESVAINLGIVDYIYQILFKFSNNIKNLFKKDRDTNNYENESVFIETNSIKSEKNNIYYKVFDNTYNNVKQENNYKTKETKKEISKLKPIDNEDIINKTINKQITKINTYDNQKIDNSIKKEKKLTRRNFIHLNKFLKQKRIRRDTKEKIQIRNEKNNNFLQNQGILKLPQKKLNNNLIPNLQEKKEKQIPKSDFYFRFQVHFKDYVKKKFDFSSPFYKESEKRDTKNFGMINSYDHNETILKFEEFIKKANKFEEINQIGNFKTQKNLNYENVLNYKCEDSFDSETKINVDNFSEKNDFNKILDQKVLNNDNSTSKDENLDKNSINKEEESLFKPFNSTTVINQNIDKNLMIKPDNSTTIKDSNIQNNSFIKQEFSFFKPDNSITNKDNMQKNPFMKQEFSFFNSATIKDNNTQNNPFIKPEFSFFKSDKTESSFFKSDSSTTIKDNNTQNNPFIKQEFSFFKSDKTPNFFNSQNENDKNDNFLNQAYKNPFLPQKIIQSSDKQVRDIFSNNK